MWKYLNESVDGTSHRQTGLACQDASFVTPYSVEDDDVIILACSDGAGSAKEAKLGAGLTCAGITSAATSFFESGHVLSELTDSAVSEWIREVRASLSNHADGAGIGIRDLACTLLFGVVGERRAFFAQVGDGAIVTLQDGRYSPVFWPQSGEYQNTTFFVTDEELDHRVQIVSIERRIDELSMFTDGLQMLALNYAGRAAHEPFFTPMFKALRAAVDRQDLIVPMRQFLDSPGVNSRTDDDKTLVLATRVPSADEIV